MKVKIAKWGNSLGLRLPKHLAEELGLTAGSVVAVDRDGTKLVAETALGQHVPYYRLQDLIAEMKRLGPENEPETVDWGPGVGAEIINDAYSRGEVTLDDILKRKAASQQDKGTSQHRDVVRRRKKAHAARRRRHRVG